MQEFPNVCYCTPGALVQMCLSAHFLIIRSHLLLPAWAETRQKESWPATCGTWDAHDLFRNPYRNSCLRNTLLTTSAIPVTICGTAHPQLARKSLAAVETNSPRRQPLLKSETLAQRRDDGQNCGYNNHAWRAVCKRFQKALRRVELHRSRSAVENGVPTTAGARPALSAARAQSRRGALK